MSLGRALFVGLVWLYPREFRVRFAPELVETFDSAVVESGSAQLLLDLVCSLQRQWLSAGLQRKRRPALVLGSIIQGEYPGFELERPDAARLVQGALVCVLMVSAAVCLNQVRTSWSLLTGRMLRVELPYSYAPGGPTQRTGAARRAVAVSGRRVHFKQQGVR